MENPSSIENRFGDAYASGDGVAFQLGANHGVININQRARQTLLPKVVYSATFDAANKEHTPSCLKGTRVELLKDIKEWIDGDNPRKVFWLSGMAGTGKSTIALTLARTYKPAIETKTRQRNASLGATFFFSRGGGELSSASKFPATIAIQLSEASDELRRLIEGVIEDNPRLDTLGIREQWEKLVIGPLSLLSQNSGSRATLLLIVDALDECNDASDINAVIRCLEEVTNISGVGCRVFLTSRPEYSIRLGMNADASVPRENFVLHNIERSIVDQDLRLYYRDQLSRIKERLHSDEDIISERTIGKLVERSHGLFIHAAVVCRFIHENGLVAVERLALLLETQNSGSAELELDKIYTTVLEYSFVSLTNKLTPDEVQKIRQSFQRVIGAIMVIFDTMSCESLAGLLGMKRDDIIRALSAFHSVILVPENHSEPIRILHPSFREFLLHPKRRTADTFYSILVSDTHSYLGTRSVAYLMSQLKRNILDISKPGAKAQDVSMDRIDTQIPMELQYASKYWWSHFQNSEDHSQKELPLILEFLEEKYLFWLECLAWLRKLGYAIQAMSNMNTILTKKSLRRKFSIWMSSNNSKSKTASQLRTFVPDALQFLLRNKLMIEEAPLQLYVSALTFSPNSSEVKKRYHKEIPSWILNKPQVPDNRKRSPHGLSIAHPSAIHSVAISPDSTLVATACGDCIVYIWDVASGIERVRLGGNPDGVAKVCFSPNGRLVAAFAQNCVSVWNIEAAFDAMIQPGCHFRFKREGSGTASSQHPKCAISPCGNLVAVADYPHDVWVWDMWAKQSVKHHFQVEPQKAITGVFFSLDGSLLICTTVLLDKSESNEILYAWRTSTGVNVSADSLRKIDWTGTINSSGGAHLIFTDHPLNLNSVLIDLRCKDSIETTFSSADGEYLSAKVHGSVLTLWVESRHKLLFMGSDSSEIKSIEFSPNGKYLISANSPDELRIWSVEKWLKPSRISLFWEVRYELSLLASFAMSDIEIRILSREVDVWIRSRDGSLLATRPRNGRTITIWDMKTGEARFRLNGGKNAWKLRFSESGNIFIAEQMSIIKFWETKTGQKGNVLKIDRRKPIETAGGAGVSDNGGKIFYPEFVIRHNKAFHNLCIWELDGIREISSLKIPSSPFSGRQIAFSPNEELYCLWEGFSAVVEIRIYPSSTLQWINSRGKAIWVGFMPDGKNILIISELDEERKHVVQIWNIEQKEFSIDFPLDDNCGMFYDRSTYSCSSGFYYGPHHTKSFISPNGKLLALGRRQPDHLEIYLLKIFDPKSICKLIDLPRKAYPFIQFAPSGTHIITEWGNVPLPGASPPHKLLFATRSWIREDGEDIMAIPSEYQYSLFGVHGHTITFCDDVKGPWFVVLDEGVKTMTP